MKRIVLLFLIILLAKTMCFSSTTSNPIEKDSIVSITSNDLKYSNLIFVEHSKLLQENELLNEQVTNYQLKTDNLLKANSLQEEEIENYKLINNAYLNRIEDLNNTIKKNNKVKNYWKVGGITVSLGLVLFLIFK